MLHVFREQVSGLSFQL